MKLLLINSNPIVSKLIRLSADKVGIEVLESETLDNVELDDVGLVFVDDKSLRKDLPETLAQKLPQAKLGFIYPKNGKKENGFSLYVQKPFLPTDFVELLKNETIGMDKKAFASPAAGAATTAVAQEAISVEDATSIPDDMLQQSIGKENPSEAESEEKLESLDGGDMELGNTEQPEIPSESDAFDPESLPEAPEGATEGLEGIEGLDTGVDSLLGNDEDEKLPFEGEEEIDLDNETLEGLERPKKEEPDESTTEAQASDEPEDDLDMGDLELGEDGELDLDESLGNEQKEKEGILDEDDIAEVKSLLEDDTSDEMSIDVSDEGDTDDLEANMDADTKDELDIDSLGIGEEESKESDDSSEADDLLADLDLDSDLPTEEAAAAEPAAEAPDDIDFELDLGDLDDEKSDAKAAEAPDDALDLDLDLDLDLGEETAEEAAAEAKSEPEPEAEKAAEPESEAPESTALDEALDEDFELDLSDLDDETEAEPKPQETQASEELDEMLDLGDSVPDEIDLGDLLDDDDLGAEAEAPATAEEEPELDLADAIPDDIEESEELASADIASDLADEIPDDIEEAEPELGLDEELAPQPEPVSDKVQAPSSAELDESDRELQSLNEVEVGAALGEEIEPPENEIAIDEPLDVVIPPIQSVAAAATEAATHELDATQPANAPSGDNSAALAAALQNLPIPALKQLLDGMQLTITIRFPDKNNEK